MKVSLVDVVANLVSLWYVLPDCELTFATIVDEILGHLNSPASTPKKTTLPRTVLHASEIGISRLKKLRKYFWRKPLKYIVQQYLADSHTDEHALIQILSDLQSTIISCESHNKSFSAFIQFCKHAQSRTIAANTITLNVIGSSSVHMFLLLQPSTISLTTSTAMQQLLIHFFLSDHKDSKESEQHHGSTKKLVMEVIGRARPKKSIMNRQCLHELIVLTKTFVEKRTSHSN